MNATTSLLKHLVIVILINIGATNASLNLCLAVPMVSLMDISAVIALMIHGLWHHLLCLHQNL